MEMNGNNSFGSKYTYGVVVRGELTEIQALIDFLKSSNLVVAHSELGDQKLFIKKDGDNTDY